MAKRKTRITAEQELEAPVLATSIDAEPLAVSLKEKPSFMTRLFRRGGWKTVIIIILIVAGWSGAVFFQSRYASLKNDPQVAAQLKTAQTLTELASIIEVPQNELPSFAMISDPSLVSADSFFEKAQAGDVLVIYAQAKQAYLYRPSQKKVINAGAFVQGSSVGSGEASSSGAEDLQNQNNEQDIGDISE